MKAKPNVPHYREHAMKSILSANDRRFYTAAVLLLAEEVLEHNNATGKQEPVRRPAIHVDMNDDRIFHLSLVERRQVAVEVGRAHAAKRGLSLTGEVEYYNVSGPGWADAK